MTADQAVVVRPRVPPLAILVAAVAATAAVAGWLMHAAFAPIAVAMAGAAWAGQLLLDRGRVQQVRFEPSGEVILTIGRFEMSFDRQQVAAIGTSGSVITGHLSLSINWWSRLGVIDPLRVGRVVVLDAEGDVHAAVRASWIVVEELSAAVRGAGLRWAGDVPLDAVTFAPPATRLEGASDSTVDVDPGLRRMRRTARSLLTRCTLVLAVILAVVILGSAVHLPEAIVDGVEVAFWIGFFLWLLLVGTERLRTRPVRAARRLTRSAEWVVADVVVLRGAAADPGIRVLVVVDPVVGQPGGSWLVEPSMTARWLQEFQRDAFWLTVSREGDSAVIASKDMRHLAVLVQRTGWAKSEAIHDFAIETLTDDWHLRPATPPRS